MTLDLSVFCRDEPMLSPAAWPRCLDRLLRIVPPGVDLILTGPAPLWLYLKAVHLLHSRVRALYCECPGSGTVRISLHGECDPPDLEH